MKVYIAGPMTGHDDFNRPAFRAAAAQLTAAGFEVISPVHDDDLEADGTARHPYEWYIRRDLREMLEADAVALLPGWSASRGARLEREVGIACGLHVGLFDDYLDRTVRP